MRKSFGKASAMRHQEVIETKASIEIPFVNVDVYDLSTFTTDSVIGSPLCLHTQPLLVEMTFHEPGH
ncbi:hypothetical protein BgiMline_013396 [Biomphalaria glabrata]